MRPKVKKIIYGDQFYKKNDPNESGSRYALILKKYFSPKSVVDVGCGRGLWLQAFKEIGAKTLIGLDGSWNSSSDMVDSSILFKAADLNLPFANLVDFKHDLVMSLEVAEHLLPVSSLQFCEELTKISDVILFSAAYSGQGGTDHINERPHSFYGNIFLKLNYVPFDLFRPIVWGDDSVGYYYQQNAFLYVRKNSSLYIKLRDLGMQQIENINFLDCIHPFLFRSYVDKSILKQIIIKITPKAMRPFLGRIRDSLFKY